MWEDKGVVIKNANLAIRKGKLPKAQQNSYKIEISAMCYLIPTRTTWKSILVM